jgi:outer membrane protein assembly factor BamE
MKKIMLIIAILFAISGCVRKISIEQGNIMTPQMVNQLHTGMTMEQVKDIMGTPILMNTFQDNRVDYVYTFKPGREKRTEKYVTLIFENGHLARIAGNMYSQVLQQ